MSTRISTFSVFLALSLVFLFSPSTPKADLCGNSTEREYTLAANTPQTVGTGLAGRKQITVCSSSGNPATVIVQCRGDGTAAVFDDTKPGLQLWPGQCRAFGTPAAVAVSCVSNTAATVVKTEECTNASAVGPILFPAPAANTTPGGTVIADQGVAGATAWPVKGAGTAGVPDTGVLSVQGIANGTPIPTKSAFSGPVTATWDSTTGLNTALQISTDGFTTVGIQYTKSGAITLGTVVFEVGDSLTGPWTIIASGRIDGSAIDTSFALSGASNGWQAFVSGYLYMQVRLSVAITNTGTATFQIMASQAGVKPAPSTVAAIIVSGSLTANQGTAGTSGAWPVTGGKTPNGAAPGATNVGVLPGVSTAAAPTLTEGYEQPLSMDLSGNLRTVASIPVVSTASTPGTCTAVTTTATLLAVNAARKAVTIQAATANTKNIRWAKAATATNTQMLLEPGQTYIFDGAGGSIYTGAYSFISEDGSSQTVCVQEE